MNKQRLHEILTFAATAVKVFQANTNDPHLLERLDAMRGDIDVHLSKTKNAISQANSRARRKMQ